MGGDRLVPCSEAEWESDVAILQRMIDANPHAIGLLDLGGHYLWVNAGFVELFGDCPSVDYCVFDDPLLSNLDLRSAFEQCERGETVHLPSLWYGVDGPSPRTEPRICLRSILYPLGSASAQVEQIVLMLQDVTEQKKAEDLLRDATSLLGSVIEQSSAGLFVIDRKSGLVRLANSSMNRMLGLGERESIVGSSIASLVERFPWSGADGFARSLQDTPAYRATYAGETVINELISVTANDGSKIWMLVSASPVQPQDSSASQAAVVVISDITEIKRAEEALAAERDRLRVTLGSIGDGVIACDRDGRVTLFNGVAERLTGIAQKDAEGKPSWRILQLLGEKNRSVYPDPVQDVLRTGQCSEIDSAILVNAQTGEECLVADRASPIVNEKGRIDGVVVVFRDITEKLRLERELQRTQKLESLGVLAGGIAHDFNNILTGVLGYLSLAKLDSSVCADTVALLEHAESASLRARDLTRQLLTFSKGGDPVRASASIREIVEQSVQHVLDGSSIVAEYCFEEHLGAVEVDRGQISQAIQNIAMNAVEAMPTGGKILVRGEAILIDKKNVGIAPGRYVRISIEDQGSGIGKEDCTRVFDPYFTTKQKASGLGLAIVHSVVTKHGGHISVESELGKGSRFVLFLPLARETHALVVAENEAISTADARILVMDDELLIREVLGAMLLRFGCKVDYANDGVECLRKWREAKEAGQSFDLVIMDLTIPGGMGGKEASRLLLEMDPSAKLIVSSGYSQDPVMAEYEKYGFIAVLPKPFGIADVAGLVKRCRKVPGGVE